MEPENSNTELLASQEKKENNDADMHKSCKHMTTEEMEMRNHPPNAVDLFISCEKLVNLDNFSKTDPYVKVYMKEERGHYNFIE